MNEPDYQALIELQRSMADPPPLLVNARDAHIVGTKERTLVYGYTAERYTFHVYLKDGLIHRLVTHLDDVIEYKAAEEFPADELVPKKRVYPEWSDLYFLGRMIRARVSFSFTRYAEPRTRRGRHPFAGRLHEDFTALSSD